MGPFAGYLGGLCRSGRAVLLLDGLNETPSHLRERKTGALRDWLRALPGEPSVIVSCRVDDYPDLPSLEIGRAHV